MPLGVKIGASIYWLTVIAAVLLPLPAKVDGILVLTGLMILVFHVLELIAVFTLLRERLKPTPADILPTLMYGAFYLRPKLEATRK